MKHEIGFKGRMLARSEDDGDGRTIEGVAVPFGDVIDVWGERETFDPDTVFEGLDSAKLYYQHDTLIGSITSGENREDGLHITARIADTQQGRDAVALLDEGALDSLSVGFVPIEDRKDKDGVTHRRKVRLLETSLVSWPAYENAKLTNHRNNNQEETPMTEQAEKWTEALAKLTNRQDEQAEILRGIETTLTSRLNQQRGTSPLGEYHSQGELLKALVSDDTGKAEAAREAYNALLSRDYTGSVVADADPQPTWIADRIRRMPVGDVSFEMRCLTAAYARATEHAARTALYGSIEAIGDTDKLAVGKTADALKPNDWIDLIIDASAKFDDVNATLDYIGVSPDVFKAIAHLTDEGNRFLDVSGQGSDTLGSLDPASISGRLLRQDVRMLDGAPNGTVVFMDKSAVTMWESNGSPFQLQADNIINLTRQFSVYGYAAFGTTFKQGILPVKFAAA